MVQKMTILAQNKTHDFPRPKHPQNHHPPPPPTSHPRQLPPPLRATLHPKTHPRLRPPVIKHIVKYDKHRQMFFR